MANNTKKYYNMTLSKKGIMPGERSSYHCLNGMLRTPNRYKFLHIMKHSLFAMALIVLFAGCKKKTLPEPTAATPVFQFSGTIDNIPVTYTAGDNLLYMFTEYYKDEQNLMSLVGYFTQYNCGSCEPYLGFEFKDKNVNIANGLYSNIFQFFEHLYFNSYSEDSILFNVPIETFKFVPDNNPAGTTYLWHFGDGDSSTQISPVHTFLTGGVKDVRLITSLNNLKDTIIIPIEASTFSDCRTQFTTIIDNQNNAVTANAEGIFKSYLWDFGDGDTSQGVTVNHTYDSTGIYEILLSTSKDNCIAKYKRRINLTGNPQIPVSNFYYSNFTGSQATLLPRVNNSTAIITLKINGKTYKSFKTNPLLNQSAKKVITIDSVLVYDKNVQGQQTIKLSGNIDLFLYNVNNSNDSIPIKSNILTIAVAFPTE